MTRTLKIAAALPLIALLAACNTAGSPGVNSVNDIERTLDTDVDGDGTITSPIGVEQDLET